MAKWLHRLSDIDESTRTAICAHCGPVPVWNGGRLKNGNIKWRCLGGKERYHHAFNKGLECERCGFVAEHRAQMDVHHKDHNHKNNDPANLETLCANCHRLAHVAR